MSLLRRLLTRGPSDELLAAEDAHANVLAQREEVTEVVSALKETRQSINGSLAPLIASVVVSRMPKHAGGES